MVTKSQSRPVVGFVEAISHEAISGWAFREGDDSPLSLRLAIDGTVESIFDCHIQRFDVASVRRDVQELCGHGAQLGFTVAIPTAYFDGNEHTVQLLAQDGKPVHLITLGGDWQDRWTFSVSSEQVIGQVEATTPDAPIHGWLVVHNRASGTKRGRNRVRITTASGFAIELQADGYRPDVAQVIGVEPHCGFIFHPPPALLGGDLTAVHFTAVPQDVELADSPALVGVSAAVGTRRGPVADSELRLSQSAASSGGAAGFVGDVQADPRIRSTRFGTDVLFGIGDILAELRRDATSRSRSDDDEKTYQSDEERLIATELDREFYLTSHADVKRSGIDPVEHYTYTGFREGRAPTRWFDQTYYLEANPDVLAAGVNPFWHFLAVGRAEGRMSSKVGGFRREIIDKLVEPQEKTRGYARATSIPKLLLSHLVTKIARDIGAAQGLVLSVSHDCYIRATGGVQIFIADEQAGFMRRGMAYLNVSPVHPDLVLAPESAHGMLQLVLNGVYLGITTPSELTAVLGQIAPRPGERRIFIVHCLLGHQPERLIDLHNAMHADQNFFWLHDFSSLCEGYNLLRNDIAYCHAPAAESLCCRVCIYGERRLGHLARVHGFFRQIPFIVVAPSRSTRRIWVENTSLPYVSAEVHEHCFLEESSVRVALGEQGERGAAGNPVRVAFVGHPGVHKGWPVFVELVDRTAHLTCFQFYHFTSSEDAPALPGVDRVIARTTPSDRDAMADALAMHSIDIVLMPAPWPETFSYVTYEALASGADVVALADSGNVADVILDKRRGIVVQNDDALFELFESLRLVHYVRMCYQEGIIAGRLIHHGTTATLVHPQTDIAAE